MAAVHCIVVGRVQGVGYRRFVQREAARLLLSGSVANRDDGSVEVWAEGETAALVELVASLERGPVGARVEDLTTSWLERAGHRGAFRIER